MNQADVTLLERARHGDRAALEELLSKYEDRVFRFGMRMCRDRDDAKDVVQDTLLALTKGVADFRGASSLSTWLFTVARNFCIKKRRRKKYAPADVASLSHDVVERVASGEPAPDERAEQRELHAALSDAIAALEPKYREVLLLRDVEGMSAAEVAEVLAISVDATKSRLHRARAQVREILAPQLSPVRAPQAVAGGGACPDVVTLLSKKLEDDIDVDTCAEMERHVTRCPRCKDACDSLKRTLALCKTAPAGDVPPDVQAAVREAMRGVLAVEASGSAR